MIGIRKLISSTVLLALSAGIASASTPWSNPVGSSDTIDYSNGNNLNDLFGSPDVNSDTFVFFPHDFVATDGDIDTNDILSVIVTAQSGHTLDSVTANTYGDWSLLGKASVDHGAILKVSNLSGPGHIEQDLTIDPGMPNFGEDGTYTGQTTVDVPNDWTSALIELTSYVHADTGNKGSTSLIQMKGSTVGVHTAAVPLPGAAVAAPAAILVGWYARRRSMRRLIAK